MDKSRRVCFLIMAITVSTVVTSPARLLWGKSKEWQEKKSYHFFIYYYPGCSQSFLGRLTEASESYYRTITQQLHFYRHDPWVWEKRAKIYVYRNKQEYLEKTKQPSWSAGYAIPVKKEIYTYAGSFGIFKGVLAHEMTHLILHEYIGFGHTIPLWLDEGVAMYIQYKTMGLLERIVAECIKPLLHSKDYIPLEELLSIAISDLDKKQPLPTGESSHYSYVDKFYLESLSVVYFLLKQYSNYNFVNLCRDLRDGREFSSAFSRHYYTIRNLHYFEKRWKEFYSS